MDNIAFERHQVGFKVTIRNSGICLWSRWDRYLGMTTAMTQNLSPLCCPLYVAGNERIYWHQRYTQKWVREVPWPRNSCYRDGPFATNKRAVPKLWM